MPFRPGTDAALVAGFAHVMITEDLLDHAFLDKYCSGFDEDHMPAGMPAGMSYESYVLGKGKDQDKNAGVGCRHHGRPGRRHPPPGPRDRHDQAGQHNPRMGHPTPLQRREPGARTDDPFEHDRVGRHLWRRHRLPARVTPLGGGAFPVLDNPVRPVLPVYRWTEAILRGKGMTYKDGIRDSVDTNSNANVTNDITLQSNMKFIWLYGSNALVNQHGDINETVKILSDESECEMIVCIDNQMWCRRAMPTSSFLTSRRRNRWICRSRAVQATSVTRS